MFKHLLIIFLLLFPIFGFAQTQIGQDIDGEVEFDHSGWSVSSSFNGSIVAIGAPRNDGTGSDKGHVRVYENIGGDWTQIGQDIDGESSGDFSGDFEAISLSSDGAIIAIGGRLNNGNGANSGHVRVYEYNGIDTWIQIGQDIDGEALSDESGTSVALSSNGRIVAIGARFNDGNGTSSGHVRVYEYNGVDTWEQIGEDIDGEAAFDYSGQSISISSDGSMVAIGAPLNGIDNNGHVRIYKYNGVDSWEQLGQDIDGEASNDVSAWSVSMSSNGSIVAIGAPGNDGNGNLSGHVRVYEYNGVDTWIQIGQDIDGELSDDESGKSVSLSANGRVVAIGAPINNGGGSFRGHVRIYQNIGNIWIQIGQDINGESKGDKSGSSVALSSDGSTVAIGANENDGIGGQENPDSGHVRIFDLSKILSSNVWVLSQFKLFPNPATNEFRILTEEGLELEHVNIYNNLGQLLGSTTSLQVNTSNYSSGVYYVQVVTSKGRATKQLVIE